MLHAFARSKAHARGVMPTIPVVSASGAPGSCHLVPELAIEEVEDFDVPRGRVDGALVEGQLGVPWLRGTSAASTRQGRGERRGIASLPPGSATPAVFAKTDALQGIRDPEANAGEQ